MSKVFFENVTVKPVTPDVSQIFTGLVDGIQLLKDNQQPTTELEEEIDSRLVELYGLSDEDKAALKAHESA